ncbi:MAG: hypothetical protein CVT48_04750 [Thermoplasmata archaeon HGW-Thermoplasmata-1]|nr:MAG: hypothetical protein CVT48_04750 [Thermoplasmata archaeon HGW-Thermoplasmata-1]
MEYYGMAAIAVVMLALSLGMSGCIVDEIATEPYGMTEILSRDGISSSSENFTVPQECKYLAVNLSASVALTVVRETGALNGISVILNSPNGKSHAYNFSESGQLSDVIPIPEAGSWTLEVTDYTTQNKVDVTILANSPKYEDWAWYKFWRN